ncbi:TLR adapter interacting with SLC15A4 on the lysosome-like [Emydura macquarii macquarii]|uniref:TLR adapter interacting with SLC15A4 on the lysosome-like n=1 Tax=Emydura macquarii macquarii TaxID=1129001 RepID=UPI00352AC976
MLAEGILTGILYKERNQNIDKPHKCHINRKNERETWKDHLKDTPAIKDFASESEKQNKIIAKGSNFEHHKELQWKSKEELPAKEHNNACVKGTISTALLIPGREQHEKQLDLYRSWSCHSIYQNYPDLHIGGDHVVDYMRDSGCIMDHISDELIDGPVLLSVDIPLGHSPLNKPLETSATKLLNGDEGGERSMTLHKQPLSNSALNNYMDRKVEELYKQFFEENLTRCGSVTNLLTSNLIMNNLTQISLQLSQEQTLEKSKAREMLFHSLALFSFCNAASGNSSEISTPNLQFSNLLSKRKN